MQLFDTASGQKREFVPINTDAVRLYTCGPTVYDVPHIGNARPAVVFDVLFRLLRSLYGDDAVVYARNYTDIDDKIIQRAAELGVPVETLTERTIAQYEDNMRALNVLEPTLKPRATHSIGAIADLIQRLCALCVAYVNDGHVLFSVEGSKQLTRLVSENVELLTGHRVAVADYKADPRDFVLWKPSKEGEPSFHGPFGLPGRPGWHVECSAMIAEQFGDTIDIHAGGNDLIFPHHTCEIMQSETATGTPLARYWIHNGMLTVNGQKMAKSAANFVTVPDALTRSRGEALRYLLLSGHYRQPLDFTWEKLNEATAALNRLYRALAHLSDVEPGEPFDDSVATALADDLSTPEALAALHGLADKAFTGQASIRRMAKRSMLDAGALLGLLQHSPEEWFQAGVDATEVERLIGLREASRRERNFAQADEIRATLRSMGVTVEDTAQGPIWHTERGQTC